MKTKSKLNSLKRTILLLLVITGMNSNALTIYVNHNAMGLNNGTSWVNAYNSLSTALSVATSGDNIWVAQGVYKPTVLVDVNLDGFLDPREATFHIVDGVSLFGGFIGTEISIDERNWNINSTILSGDLDNNDINIDGNNIAENTSQIIGNNAFHIIYTENVSLGTILNGFIITGGNASVTLPATDANGDGGGWFNKLSGVVNASSPSIYNNTFSGNFAVSEGGALYNSAAPSGGVALSTIDNCRFVFNKSNLNGGAIALGSYSPGNYQPNINKCYFEQNQAYRRGGALYFIGDHAVIDSCIIKNNSVTAVSPDMSTLPGSGGGALLVGTNAVFSACLFEANSSTGNPTGAFEGGGGGGVYLSMNEPQTLSFGSSEPQFINCVFRLNTASGNTAAWGGAVNHLNDGGILNPNYVNCVFVDNSSQNTGGAIAAFTRVIGSPEGYSPSLSLKFTNCTFNSNSALQRGGAIFYDGYLHLGVQVLQSRIENSILWNNSAGVDGPQVHSDATNLVLYSNIMGSGGSGPGWLASIGTDGGNNLDTDPEYTDEANHLGIDNTIPSSDDGLRLSPTSPLINQGNNSAPALSGISKDIIGNPRIISSTVDMGAYERSGIILPDFPIYWLYDWRPYFPGCLTCPWTFNFSDKILGRFIWSEPAQLRFDDSGATITGKIKSTLNREITFNVFLKLTRQSNWKEWNAMGRTYTAISPQVRKLAGQTHIDWTYWELSEKSYLEANGNFNGILYLKHYPINKKTGFQLGIAANALDVDLGLNGNFIYQGQLSYGKKKFDLKGIGSLHADAKLCKSNCEQNNYSESNILKNIQIDISDGEPDITIYPIPATEFIYINGTEFISAIKSIELYDTKGTMIKSFPLSLREMNDYSLNISDIKKGIYLLKVITQKDEMVMKKLIIQ